MVAERWRGRQARRQAGGCGVTLVRALTDWWRESCSTDTRLYDSAIDSGGPEIALLSRGDQPGPGRRERAADRWALQDPRGAGGGGLRAGVPGPRRAARSSGRP